MAIQELDLSLGFSPPHPCEEQQESEMVDMQEVQQGLDETHRQAADGSAHREDVSGQSTTATLREADFNKFILPLILRNRQQNDASASSSTARGSSSSDGDADGDYHTAKLLVSSERRQEAVSFTNWDEFVRVIHQEQNNNSGRQMKPGGAATAHLSIQSSIQHLCDEGEQQRSRSDDVPVPRTRDEENSAKQNTSPGTLLPQEDDPGQEVSAAWSGANPAGHGSTRTCSYPKVPATPQLVPLVTTHGQGGKQDVREGSDGVVMQQDSSSASLFPGASEVPLVEAVVCGGTATRKICNAVGTMMEIAFDPEAVTEIRHLHSWTWLDRFFTDDQLVPPPNRLRWLVHKSVPAAKDEADSGMEVESFEWNDDSEAGCSDDVVSGPSSSKEAPKKTSEDEEEEPKFAEEDELIDWEDEDVVYQFVVTTLAEPAIPFRLPEEMDLDFDDVFDAFCLRARNCTLDQARSFVFDEMYNCKEFELLEGDTLAVLSPFLPVSPAWGAGNRELYDALGEDEESGIINMRRRRFTEMLLLLQHLCAARQETIIRALQMLEKNLCHTHTCFLREHTLKEFLHPLLHFQHFDTWLFRTTPTSICMCEFKLKLLYPSMRDWCSDFPISRNLAVAVLELPDKEIDKHARRSGGAGFTDLNIRKTRKGNVQKDDLKDYAAKLIRFTLWPGNTFLPADCVRKAMKWAHYTADDAIIDFRIALLGGCHVSYCCSSEEANGQDEKQAERAEVRKVLAECLRNVRCPDCFCRSVAVNERPTLEFNGALNEMPTVEEFGKWQVHLLRGEISTGRHHVDPDMTFDRLTIIQDWIAEMANNKISLERRVVRWDWFRTACADLGLDPDFSSSLWTSSPPRSLNPISHRDAFQNLIHLRETDFPEVLKILGIMEAAQGMLGYYSVEFATLVEYVESGEWQERARQLEDDDGDDA
ncbi:unnamed protein product [Amoebophrya sp. A120]|nr:unnamed protein product [Amoebophrya sp. A120]|eukprot:GSA120T00021228001.1